MESGKTIGGLAAFLVLCIVFSFAMPRKPGEVREQKAGSTRELQASEPVPPAPTRARDPEPVAPQDLVEGRWAPKGFGFDLPAPEGWSTNRRRKNAYLQRDGESMLAGNFSALRLPNLFGKDLPGLLEENRAELDANEQFELQSSELIELDGRQVLRIEYQGTPRDGAPVHFLGTIWLAGADQVVLTFSAAPEAWSAVEADVRAALAELRFGSTAR